MQTHNLGYPRIGSRRELKKACEQYWSGKITLGQLEATGKSTGMITGIYKKMLVWI